MQHYVSVGDNGKIINVYGSLDTDPDMEKHPITDAEFERLRAAKSFDEFVLVDGVIYADAAYAAKTAISEIEAAVDAKLNSAANAAGYDSIHTASLRAAIPNSPYHAEGVAFAEWMDACYAKCYELIEQYKAGAFESMTADDVLSQLPAAPVVSSKPAI